VGAGVSAWGNSWLKAWGSSWGQVGEVAEPRHTGGGDDSHVNLAKLREGIKRAQEERDRLEAERLAEIEREASEVLARIARANDPVPSEPVVIPMPEAIEPEIVAKVEPLAPVNGLATNLLLINEQISVSQIQEFETQAALSITSDTQRQRDEDEALAIILILAEID